MVHSRRPPQTDKTSQKRIKTKMPSFQGDIDCVVLWVDGSDPQWQHARAMSLAALNAGSSLIQEKAAGQRRYRDWNIFKYFFRAIETNTPWFNKIHLVTCGQVPEWLNLKHPKLCLVNHRDIFKDPTHLPVFNTNAIHANLLGIPNLSEKFVLFDDDLFILNPTPPNYFFENEMPKDYIKYSKMNFRCDDPGWLSALYQTIEKMQKTFKVNKKTLLDLPLIAPDYGILLNSYNLFNFLASFFQPRTIFTPLGIRHYPQPLLKQSLRVINQFFEVDVMKTSKHKFRHPEDITSYMYRYWHLLNKKFVPFFESPNILRMFSLQDYEALTTQVRCLEDGKVRFLCINDDVPNTTSEEDLTAIEKLLTKSMEKVFPNKSMFEIS